MADPPPNLHKLAYGKKMNFFPFWKLVFLNADLKSTQNSTPFSCVKHQNRTSGSRVQDVLTQKEFVPEGVQPTQKLEPF